MLTNGYIKEYRSLLSWGWFKDPFTAHLWEYLRLAANWDEAVFKGKPVRRGELVTSYPAMAEATGMSVQNVRTAIKHLKQTGEVEMKSFRDFSIVTIVNYDRYQADNSLDNSQLTGCQQPANRQLTTIEESKKARKQERKKRITLSLRSRVVRVKTEEQEMKRLLDTAATAAWLGLLTTAGLSDNGTLGVAATALTATVCLTAAILLTALAGYARA